MEGWNNSVVLYYAKTSFEVRDTESRLQIDTMIVHDTRGIHRGGLAPTCGFGHARNGRG